MIRGSKDAHTYWFVLANKNLKDLILSTARIVPLLKWEWILWAKSKGCHFLDTEGSPETVEESNPLYRIQQFKRGFHPIVTQKFSQQIGNIR